MMNRTTKPPVALLLLALAAAGCGGGTDPAASAENAETATEAGGAARFAESLEDEPCTLLTAEVVSEAAGVPADALERWDVVGCKYSWNDGDGEVSIGMVRVYEDAASARASFEASTRELSAEEIDEAMGRIGDQMEEDGATEDEAAAGEALGGALFEGGIQHDPVDGVGDGAAFYYSTLTVLKDNVTFNVEAYPPDAEQAAQREMAVRLARAIVAHMAGL